MSRLDFLLEILKNEYGICTMKQLDEAIASQKRLDIAVFCLDLMTEGSA